MIRKIIKIDEDKCIRCGYCFRSCPTDAIKYGEILPKTVKEGKTLCIDQDQCIGCMTCTRICPSKGAINVGKTNKLPFIDPAYCARCEECMHSCPTYAIDYVEREEAFESFNKIKTLEIASEIIDRDIHNISKGVTNIDNVLVKTFPRIITLMTLIMKIQWISEMFQEEQSFQMLKYSHVPIADPLW